MSRAMKDSGIPWIGEIPEGWKLCRIKDCTDIVMGQSPDGDSISSEPIGFLFMQGNAEFTEKYPNPTLYCQNPNKLSRVGDILMSVRAPVGALNISDKIYGIGRGLCSIKNINIDKSYLWYYLLKSSVDFDYYGNGSTFSAITVSSLNNFPLVLPSISEQQRIAEFLDRKCAEVDEMIALQEKIVEELKAYKQSVITEAVTKGLNPAVPMKDSGIEWIGQIPEHWEVKPIKYIKSKEKNSFADGPFGSNLKSEHFVENGDVLVIESGFITTGKFIYKDFKTITKEHFETIKRSECKAKDIIIAKIGANYGMSGELPVLDKPSVVSGNSLKITLDNKKYLNPIFVYAMMTAKSNKGFLDLVQENAQPALSLSGLNNFRLPSAPIEEQQAIAEYLDKKCSEIDKLISIKLSKIESLKE